MSDERPTLDDLFSGWATKSHDDPASLAAAASMLGAAGTQRVRIMRLLQGEGRPLAEWEIDQVLRLSGNAVRPRLVELREARLVEREETPLGTTPSGRSCYRHRLTALGRQVLDEYR